MTHTLARSVAIVALFVAAPRARAGEQQRVAYVDLQRAIQETTEGKHFTETIRQAVEKVQRELDAKEKELETLRLELERQLPVLTPAAAAQRRADLERKLLEHQSTYRRLQSSLDEKKNVSLQKLLKKMSSLVAGIAQAEGVTFVFERNSGLVYAPPSLDLTNELIRRCNAEK